MAENPGAPLRNYACAFSVLAVVAIVVDNEIAAATCLIAAVNIACTDHLCRRITAREQQS